jgi:serine/threonine protein kinase
MFIALNYLHSQKICHRDIKLENIMLQSEGDLSVVKLIDFGLSRNISCSEDIRSLCSGTPFYIAPEVINL